MLDFIQNAFRTLYNVEAVVRYGGTFIVCAFVYVETGLFVGFFLPGDSLLVTAGIFAAAGQLKLAALLLFVTLCAVAGDQTNYFICRKAGQALYRREDSLFFKKKHLQRAHEFYEKHGPKMLILARFIPIVRTFAPAVAGAAAMRYRRFLTYSVIGGILWVQGMILTGFFLGSVVPNIGKRIHLVIALVIFISLLPAIFEILRSRLKKHKA